MKINISKAKKSIKPTLIALLATYISFYLYGRYTSQDFCHGPMGPADPREKSSCIQLNLDAYQRLPLLIDHPAFEDCSFSRLKRGNHWTVLNCLNDKNNHGILDPMDDVESECTVFKNQTYKEILSCIETDREAKGWVLDNQSNPYYAACKNYWSQYSHIEMCMNSPAWRKYAL